MFQTPPSAHSTMHDEPKATVGSERIQGPTSPHQGIPPVPLSASVLRNTVLNRLEHSAQKIPVFPSLICKQEGHRLSLMPIKVGSLISQQEQHAEGAASVQAPPAREYNEVWLLAEVLDKAARLLRTIRLSYSRLPACGRRRSCTSFHVPAI